MRKRHSLLAVPLVVAGLLVSGCGSAADTEAPAPSAGATDAKAILAAIKPVTTTGPQKIGVSLGVTLKGQLKDPTIGALLGNGPITVDIAGPIDVAGKTADVTFDVKAGKVNLAGEVMAAGDKGYVKLNNKWYALPADVFKGTSTGTAGANIDPGKILTALGDPSALVSNAKVVGAEDIEGIATDHVSGDVNTAEVVAAIGRVAGAIDATSSPISADEINKATAELGKFVKSATIDWWIGSEDKQVHRVKLDADLALDDEAKQSSGLDGVAVTVTITSTPTDAPTISEPSGVLPAEQLSKDLLPAILAGLGGPTP